MPASQAGGPGFKSRPVHYKRMHETAWAFLGMDKTTLEGAHTLSGVAMIALVIVHLAINLDMLVNELKVLTRR